MFNNIYKKLIYYYNKEFIVVGEKKNVRSNLINHN